MDPNASFCSSTSSLESLSAYFKRSERASLEVAESHLLASSVTKLSQVGELPGAQPQERCECCLFPVHAPRFPLLAIDSLAEMGTAVPLYFYFNLHLIAMMLVVSVVAGVPATISNLLLGSESELPLTRFSIAMHVKPLPLWPILLHLIAIILLCLIYISMAITMKRLTIKLNEGVCRLSHFAVLLKNLDSNWDKMSLKKHIEENMQPGERPINVVKIHTCYNIIEFERVIKRIRKIKAREECYLKQNSTSLSKIRRCWAYFVRAVKYHAGPITEDEIKTEMDNLDKEIEQISKQKWSKTGVAIVVFETNKQAKAFIKKWKRGLTRRYCCCCLSAMDDTLHYNGQHIYVKKAPEPNDVLWGNLKYPRLTRTRTQIVVIFVVLAVLFFNFMVLSYIASQKAGIKSKEDSKYGSCNYDNGKPDPNPNPDPINSFGEFFLANWPSAGDKSGNFLASESASDAAYNQTTIKLYFSLEENSGLSDEIETSSEKKHKACYADKTSMISFVIANSIFILNLLISLVSLALSKAEHHHTYTTESLFISWKLIVFKSLNMIALPLLVNMRLTDLNTEEGLAPDILHVALQTLVMPFMKFVQFVISSLKRQLYRYWVRSGTYFSSQEALNQCFEYPDAEVATWYVTLICNLLLTLAYTPLIPVIAPIMCGSLIIDFCVSKFVLLRLSRRPRPLNERIARISMQFVKPAIVLYGAGMFASSLRTVSDDAMKVCFAALIVSAGFWFVPTSVFERLLRRFWERPHNKEEKSHTEASNPVLNVSDSQRYELSNPVTRVKEFASNMSKLRKFIFEEEAKPRMSMSHSQPMVEDDSSFKSFSTDSIRAPVGDIDSH